jgi:hypothetical protein
MMGPCSSRPPKLESHHLALSPFFPALQERGLGDQQRSKSDYPRLVLTVSRLTTPASATGASSKDTNSANKPKPSCTPHQIQAIKELIQVPDNLQLKGQKASNLSRAAPLMF